MFYINDTFHMFPHIYMMQTLERYDDNPWLYNNNIVELYLEHIGKDLLNAQQLKEA